MNPNIEFKQFEAKASYEGKRTIKGYAAAFGNVDKTGDIIHKGAFSKTIQENGKNVKLIVQHELKSPIGKVTMLKEDDYGLYFEAKIANTPAGDEYLQLMKEGVIDKFSIGYKTIRFKRTEEGGRDLFELKLFEVSPVTIPMNDKAYLIEAKSEITSENVLDRFDKLAKLVGTGMATKGLELQLEAEVHKLAEEYKSATQPDVESTEPEVTAEAKNNQFLTELNEALK